MLGPDVVVIQAHGLVLRYRDDTLAAVVEIVERCRRDRRGTVLVLVMDHGFPRGERPPLAGLRSLRTLQQVERDQTADRPRDRAGNGSRDENVAHGRTLSAPGIGDEARAGWPAR